MLSQSTLIIGRVARKDFHPISMASEGIVANQMATAHPEFSTNRTTKTIVSQACYCPSQARLNSWRRSGLAGTWLSTLESKPNSLDLFCRAAQLISPVLDDSHRRSLRFSDGRSGVRSPSAPPNSLPGINPRIVSQASQAVPPSKEYPRFTCVLAAMVGNGC